MNHLEAWDNASRTLNRQAKRVIVVGAGMIGCEVAEDLCRAGHSVTLINDKSLPLPSVLPEKASKYLVGALRRLGVKFIGGAEILGANEDSSGQRSMLLARDSSVPYDHLIIATGLVTDTRIAERRVSFR